MSTINKKLAPYYDDYDPSKQYFQILALPGRVAQSREITQIQSILLDVIKNLGDAFLRNGSVIEGCQISVSPDKKSVLVSEGKVYLGGVILPVEATTVNIDGVGVEKIGIKLVESIVDESQDPTLRDPAQGYDNYDQPGAHRLKKVAKVVVNDPDSATLTTLNEGVPVVENEKPNYDTLEQTLARRTFDESGSYIVQGLKVRVEPNNDTHVNVVVEAGKAYVLGYELKKPAPVRIPVLRSKEESRIVASNYIFTDGQTRYQIDSNPFVARINSVRGTAAYTENLIQSTNVDAVLLTQLEVIRLTSVQQGSTTFHIGSGPGDGDCYLLRSGSRYYIKWNGGNAPVAGVSYTVTYEYTKEFAQGVDYRLILNDTAHELEWIDGGSTPLPNTNFTIDYNEYLARKDIVYMDQYGQVSVIQGTPAEYGFETAPSAPLNTLALAIIHHPPNGDAGDDFNSYDIYVQNVGLTRFTMQDIYDLVQRVKRNEYDKVQLELSDDARQRTTASAKKGIFTDALVDFSKMDITFNKDSTTGGKLDPNQPLFDIALDFMNCNASLPIKSQFHEITVDMNSSDVKIYNRLVSMGVTGERVVVSQPYATKTFNVNPYSMFHQLPEVSINPAVDNWVEETIIRVPRSVTNPAQVVTTVRNIDNWLTPSQWTGGGTRTTVTETQSTQTTTRTYTELLREEAVTYIRPRVITITGTKFAPRADNIECFFDGRRVDLTPATGYTAGTIPGSVRADANGKVVATFTIPEGVRTGVREVMLKCAQDIDGYGNTGFTMYQAYGINRIIQQTIETVTTILIRRTITNITDRLDPVGQTFILDRMTILKAVEVYFRQKANTTPITLEIREVQNGTITGTVLASKTLQPEEVIISSDASKATRFTFDDPVLLEENTDYAFVLRSLSDQYLLWVAELEGKDVLTKATVIKNPYMPGVMMSSSNNSSWTTHQTMDVKFNLIEEVYKPSGTLIFEPLTVEQASRILLAADSVIPKGCELRWFYQINNSGLWRPITPLNLVELTEMFTTLQLKIEMSRSSDSNLSPLLALDAIQVMTSTYDTEGSYVSLTVTGLDPYTNVDVILDTYIPSGTFLDVKVQGDGSVWESTTLDNTATKNLDNYWKEQTYKGTVVPGSRKFKLRIDLSSSRPALTPRFSKIRCIMS